MSTIAHGARNVLRNKTRTCGVVVILALSTGLALVMLLSLRAVQSRITSIKASIGNTVTIQPAGFSGFSAVSNALTTSELAPISSLPHVTRLVEVLTDRLTTAGTQSFGRLGDNAAANQTNLSSPVKLNASRAGHRGARLFISGGGQLPSGFSLPITVEGTTDPTQVGGNAITVTSGTSIDGTKDTNNALVSQDMASKNHLAVGSTFSAYNATLTVAGIFRPASGTNQAAANAVVLSLQAVQRLSGQSGDVTSATAYVDSVSNMGSVQSAISSQLGSSADVSNAQTQAQNAIQPLQSIQAVASYGLVGSLVAGSLIIFLTMLMIVRERRREIGVLKAIGASNITITTQFVSEALALTLGGSLVGLLGGLALANPMLKLLVASNTQAPPGFAGRGGFAGGAGRGFDRAFGGVRTALGALHATVGYEVLLYGFVATLFIAIIGSAIPAFVIAKIQPAEVMRGE